ncbi:MAG: hypothetical protein U9R34_02055 [Nanoarchaeota archaeon]|nr:hypothetical protein [Nanoarchaeota archaeon]
MMKKGQAAMEFLMTYGWAILVVLAAIGALAYFGVLSPDSFLPEKCMLEPGVDCTGFKVTPTETTLVMRNGMGRDLTVNGVAIGDCNSTTGDVEFKNGDMVTIILTGCSNGALDDRFDSDISISYTEKISGLSKTMGGSMTTKVQS